MSFTIVDDVRVDAASAVIAQVAKLLPENVQRALIVDDYKAVHEKGYTICNMQIERQVSFSEYAGTFELVVYYGHPFDFKVGKTNVGQLEKSAASQEVFFQCDADGFTVAAKWIAKYLTGKKVSYNREQS